VAKPYRPDEILECMERHLRVRYRRDNAAMQSAGTPTSELPADAIAALPPALRAELRNAVVTLNQERISEVIKKVAAHDEALGAMLARCAETFQYTSILSAVEGGTGGLTATGA
jgi:hypothetical protein